MIRSALFCLFAILQPLAGGFSQYSGIGTAIGERARENGIPPELPLGIFFSIWSIIFLLYAVCAVMSFRAQPGSALDRATTPLIIAGAGNVAWMMSNQLVGYRPLDLALIAVLLAIAVWAVRAGQSGRERSLLVDAETGLLAGWLTAATSISFAPALRTFTGHGATDAVWGYAALTGGAALVFVIAIWRRFFTNIWYLVALGWGVLGLVLNNLQRTDLTLIGYGFAALIAVILLYAQPWKPAPKPA